MGSLEPPFHYMTRARAAGQPPQQDAPPGAPQQQQQENGDEAQAAPADPVEQEMPPIGPIPEEEPVPLFAWQQGLGDVFDFLPFLHDLFMGFEPSRHRRNVHYIGGCLLMVAVATCYYYLCKARSDTDGTEREAAWPAPPWLFWRERTGDNPYPRILLWNRFIRPFSFLTQDAWGPEKRYSSHIVHCSPGGERPVMCEVTDNRSRLMWSDAIVFEAEVVNALDFPYNRSAAQLWVMWAQTRVAPMKSDVLARPDPTGGSFYNDIGPLFNWTMGHREDADIVVPYMFWRCGVPDDEPLATFPQKLETRERLGIAWIVGECEQRSFAEELSLGPDNVQSVLGDLDIGSVAVHQIPSCGSSLCENQVKCIRHIAERFKFILVSMVPDCFDSPYEVIYEAFKYSLVPIVLAPPNTTLNVPNHSVVTSANLQRPGELADHVNYLLKSPNIYSTYFKWKEVCSLIPYRDSFCSLCRALWETPLRKQMHVNARDWWIAPAYCTEGKKPLYGLDWAFQAARQVNLE